MTKTQMTQTSQREIRFLCVYHLFPVSYIESFVLWICFGFRDSDFGFLPFWRRPQDVVCEAESNGAASSPSFAGESDTELFDLVVEGSSADAEQLRGILLNPFGPLQGSTNKLAFVFIYIKRPAPLFDHLWVRRQSREVEILWKQNPVGGDDHSGLDRVFELPDVARPGIFAEPRDSLRR